MITLENRINEFKKVCKVFNLDYEYKSCDEDIKGCVGDKKYAIITALTDKELQEQFGDVVNACYSPYLLLDLQQGAAIIESKNNDSKHRMRSIRYGHNFDIRDGEFEEHHPEAVVEVDPVDEIMLKDNIEKLRKELSNLKEVQKRRIIKYFFYDMTYEEIAEEEGVSHTAVKYSIDAAINNLKKLFI